ncbi:hypothetical protein QR680_015304 [Steinernema hermaphroditum]|uniref:Uncharacterized protein n=1 Tax=Steinernema hermaphroditum TaxID=289476 RepID=A0AA39H788_9BILA|nr:hypothetical protein QR680_015304 [Steinernema hermaphroditum]
MSPDKFLSYVLTGISYSFAIPFFYIVIFKSPPSIRVYRCTILNLALWDIIAMGSYTIFLQPVYTLLPNKSCARFVGLVSYFGIETNIAEMYFIAVLCLIAFPFLVVYLVYTVINLVHLICDDCFPKRRDAVAPVDGNFSMPTFAFVDNV